MSNKDLDYGVMTLKDCSEYHIRQMLGGCQAMLHQYKTLSNYDISAGTCKLCAVEAITRKAEDFNACQSCAWYIITGRTCTQYGSMHRVKRITELTEWIVLMEAELQRRGLS
jgi:ribosomal protein L32